MRVTRSRIGSGDAATEHRSLVTWPRPWRIWAQAGTHEACVSLAAILLFSSLKFRQIVADIETYHCDARVLRVFPPPVLRVWHFSSQLLIEILRAFALKSFNSHFQRCKFNFRNVHAVHSMLIITCSRIDNYFKSAH